MCILCASSSNHFMEGCFMFQRMWGDVFQMEGGFIFKWGGGPIGGGHQFDLCFKSHIFRHYCFVAEVTCKCKQTHVFPLFYASHQVQFQIKFEDLKKRIEEKKKT